MTPTEGVERLLFLKRHLEELNAAVETTKAEIKALEEVTLPPIFQNARQSLVEIDGGAYKGAQARKSPYAYARLEKEGPKRAAMLAWLEEIGENNSLTAKVELDWPRGQLEIARKVAQDMIKDGTAKVKFTEDIHWKTLEGIVLRAVTGGKHFVPLDAIGARFGDRVTIVKQPTI